MSSNLLHICNMGKDFEFSEMKNIWYSKRKVVEGTTLTFHWQRLERRWNSRASHPQLSVMELRISIINIQSMDIYQTYSQLRDLLHKLVLDSMLSKKSTSHYFLVNSAYTLLTPISQLIFWRKQFGANCTISRQLISQLI